MLNHCSRQLLPFYFVLIAGAFHAAVAHADSAPPIKAGLWQVHSEREIDGTQIPDVTAHMQNLPPDMRERMQSMMKQNGVDIAGGGDLKVCLSKESLDAGRWQNMQPGNCKTTYADRTSKHWAWHALCTEPNMEANGEANFIDSEHYTADTTIKSNMLGADRVTHLKLDSRWLGADCGDIKPVNADMLREQKINP